MRGILVLSVLAAIVSLIVYSFMARVFDGVSLALLTVIIIGLVGDLIYETRADR